MQHKFKLFRPSIICKLGFTLAEVLITLGIIGVVAEMTIPTVMSNIQDQTYKASWKKAFSIINQATLQIATDNGTSSLAGSFVDTPTTLNLYSGKLKVINKCLSSCTFAGAAAAYNSVITLVDGSMLMLGAIDTNCSTAWGPTNFGQSLCAEFYVDTNGAKPPNIGGKDVLWVGVKPNGSLLPGGSQGITNAGYNSTSAYANALNYLFQ